MSRLSVYLPPFAADYSGVCSVLFELNCLITINDAHCCTGNYVHFDEPRWAIRRRPTLCTMLRTIDAVFGNDEKMATQVSEASEKLDPDFTAVLGSPVPAIIGMDLMGVAGEIEARWGKPVLGFDTTGFSFYDRGISMALTALLQRFAEEMDDRTPHSVNILGVTPLDLGVGKNAEALREYLEKRGFAVISCCCMDLKLQDIQNAGKASVNLVVSAGGIEAARYLEKRFGTPWMADFPMGEAYGETFLERLEALCRGEKEGTARYEATETEPGILIVWDQVLGNALRCALRQSGARGAITVAGFFTMDGELSSPEDIHIRSEKHLSEMLESGDFRVVVGDPLLAELPAMRGISLYELPHPAVSSRLYWEKVPELLKLDIDAIAAGKGEKTV